MTPQPIGSGGSGGELAVLKRPLLLVLGVVAVGTVGYMLIEGWDFFDSIYMVLTTITTVGFGEINPLSNRGRAFTMLLIVLGVGTMLYTLSAVVHYAVVGELTRRVWR